MADTKKTEGKKPKAKRSEKEAAQKNIKKALAAKKAKHAAHVKAGKAGAKAKAAKAKGAKKPKAAKKPKSAAKKPAKKPAAKKSGKSAKSKAKKAAATRKRNEKKRSDAAKKAARTRARNEGKKSKPKKAAKKKAAKKAAKKKGGGAKVRAKSGKMISKKQMAAAKRNIKKAQKASKKKGGGKGKSKSKGKKKPKSFVISERKRGSKKKSIWHLDRSTVTGRFKHAAENPMTIGIAVAGGIGGGLGWIVPAAVDRFLATHALTKNADGVLNDIPPPATFLQANNYNQFAVEAPMGLKRWIGAFAVIGGGTLLSRVKWTPLAVFGGSFAVMGALRTTVHGVTDLLAYLTGKTKFGQRYFQQQIQAQNIARRAKATSKADPNKTLRGAGAPLRNDSEGPDPQAITWDPATMGLGFAFLGKKKGLGGACCSACAKGNYAGCDKNKGTIPIDPQLVPDGLQPGPKPTPQPVPPTPQPAPEPAPKPPAVTAPAGTGEAETKQLPAHSPVIDLRARLQAQLEREKSRAAVNGFDNHDD